MNYHYAYLSGTAIFGAAWVVCFVIGKRYRSQMIWGTGTAAPLALTSVLFVPQYWTPPSLFDLDARFRVGIEDFLWAAAVGGIASVIAEILLKEELAEHRKHAHKRHYAPFVMMSLIFIALEFWRPGKTIYNTIASFAVCAVIVAFLRRDLILSMIVGVLDFTVLYFLLFVYFLWLYPDFVRRYYNVSNLLGVYVVGVPIEEILFAASGGAVWSVTYEYVMGYRFATGKELAPVDV